MTVNKTPALFQAYQTFLPNPHLPAQAQNPKERKHNKRESIWQVHDEEGGSISVVYFPNTAWDSYYSVGIWESNAVLGKPRLFW